MMGFANPNAVCFMCGRKPLPDDEWCGANMWHTHAFTCRHETQYSCPECEAENPDRYAKCSQCGCGEEYT